MTVSELIQHLQRIEANGGGDNPVLVLLEDDNEMPYIDITSVVEGEPEERLVVIRLGY